MSEPGAVGVEWLERRTLLFGAVDFVTTFGSASSQYADEAVAVASDYGGNVYVAGRFFGTVDFDGRRNHSFELTSAGRLGADTPRHDAFVAKYSPAGVLVWARQLTITGDGSTSASGMVGDLAVDRAGAVYVTGLFDGTVDFNPRRGAFRLTAEENHASVFAWKLDAEGNLAWARRVDNPRSSPRGAMGNDIALGVEGDVFVAGEFDSSGDVLDGAAFVARLDGTTGAVTWTQDLLDEAPGAVRANAVTTDRVGNVLITGRASGATDPEDLSADSFVAKLGRDATLAWARFLGGESLGEWGQGIVTDRRGNVFTTGAFGGTAVDFDPGLGVAELASAGSTDAYVARLDPGGNFVWARRLGGPDRDWANDLALRSDGSIEVAGQFRGAGDFDPRRGVYEMDAGAAHDVFLVTLTGGGNLVRAGSVGAKRGQAAQRFGLWLDRSDQLLLAGGFGAALDFEPGAGVLVLESAGSYDAFVLKLLA